MLVVGATDHPLDYRFERGAEMEYWTMGYLQNGVITTRTAKGRYERSAGSISLIPPHTAYVLEWGGGSGIWSEKYAVFSPPTDWNHLLSWPIQSHGLGVILIKDLDIKRSVEETFDEAMQLLRSARPCRLPLAFNALERLLLILDEVNPLRGYQQLDSRVRQTLQYVSEHYQSPINISILARHVCLSPSRFAHLFRSQMNAAPMQHVEHYRLERAAEKLLSSNQSIEQVAYECGFVNAYHFSARFRRYFKQAPSRYRLNPK